MVWRASHSICPTAGVQVDTPGTWNLTRAFQPTSKPYQATHASLLRNLGLFQKKKTCGEFPYGLKLHRFKFSINLNINMKTFRNFRVFKSHSTWRIQERRILVGVFFPPIWILVKNENLPQDPRGFGAKKWNKSETTAPVENYFHQSRGSLRKSEAKMCCDLCHSHLEFWSFLSGVKNIDNATDRGIVQEFIRVIQENQLKIICHCFMIMEYLILWAGGCCLKLHV